MSSKMQVPSCKKSEKKIKSSSKMQVPSCEEQLQDASSKMQVLSWKEQFQDAGSQLQERRTVQQKGSRTAHEPSSAERSVFERFYEAVEHFTYLLSCLDELVPNLIRDVTKSEGYFYLSEGFEKRSSSLIKKMNKLLLEIPSGAFGDIRGD